jgi:hemoglobin-like flavoprotein
MTPRQKDLVQQTFAKVVPIAPMAATLFYDRLFTLDPSLRRLFKDDLEEQKQKLMQMLAVAVRGLDDPGTLTPAVRALGARHLGYGVEAGHYATVGEALLWTLGQGLGEAFTGEVREAWATVYGLLAGLMQQGAAEATQAR